MNILVTVLVSIGVLTAFPTTSFAQALREARLFVTVVDQTGGVIPGATVTIAGLDAAAQSTTSSAAQTNEKGVATLERVTPGRYDIQGQFPDFELGRLRDVRVSPGDNRHVIVLQLEKVAESISVDGGRAAAAARTTQTFGLSLTETQIDALSDDPAELLRQINQLGGPEAIIRVDSFEGQQLPPKAQIKSIHVTRDQFAAEAEYPGSTFVDVVLQPGVGAIRGGASFSFRNGSMDGHNQFLRADARTPGQFRNYSFNLGGALIDERADFSVAVTGNNDYRLPILNENKITGAVSHVLNRRESVDVRNINGLLNYALTRDQTLRLGYTQQNRLFSGGIGGWDDLERGYSTDYASYGVRLMEAGAIGRRMFINSRLNLAVVDQTRRSAVEKPTIVVLDAMTTGGAQVAGGTRSRNFVLESDLDYVRGIHSWRAGVKVYGGSFRTDERTNYLGTYTFSSTDDYASGKPALYTVETGDPSFSYFNAQGAFYVQDDIRIAKSVTLSPGVRYSRQTRIARGGIAPRFGVTWAPARTGRTTLRASAGRYHSWLATGTLAQAIRLDGTHQRQLIVNNPSYPDAGFVGVMVPATTYLIGGYDLVNNVRYSAGIDQMFSPRVRASLVYSYWYQTNLPRGLNVNPIVDGVRSRPEFGNIIATVTDARLRRHDVQVSFNVTLAQQRQMANTARFDWKRMTVTGMYALGQARRNAAGPFDVAPSGSLDTEWGRGPFDYRYYVNAAVTSTQVRNLSVNIGLNFVDAYPYHHTTGRDDNGDGILNDRPARVGLWSLRGDGQETVSARVAYTFMLDGSTPGEQTRYRANVFVNVHNVTNHANYTGYSGVMTSPNYRHPTAVLNPRQITMGFGVNF